MATGWRCRQKICIEMDAAETDRIEARLVGRLTLMKGKNREDAGVIEPKGYTHLPVGETTCLATDDLIDLATVRTAGQFAISDVRAHVKYGPDCRLANSQESSHYAGSRSGSGTAAFRLSARPHQKQAHSKVAVGRSDPHDGTIFLRKSRFFRNHLPTNGRERNFSPRVGAFEWPCTRSARECSRAAPGRGWTFGPCVCSNTDHPVEKGANRSAHSGECCGGIRQAPEAPGFQLVQRHSIVGRETREIGYRRVFSLPQRPAPARLRMSQTA